MNLDPFVKGVLKELLKHAKRDDCYSCKQLLRDFGSRYGIKDTDKFLEGLLQH